MALVEDWINPKHIVFMHLPPEPGKIAKIAQQLEDVVRRGLVFTRQGRERSFR